MGQVNGLRNWAGMMCSFLSLSIWHMTDAAVDLYASGIMGSGPFDCMELHGDG